MNNNTYKNLSEDLSSGLPQDMELAIPTKIAQHTLFSLKNFKENDVQLILNELDLILEMWKESFGKPRPLSLLDSPPEDCSSSRPWHCSDYNINSANDLYADLLYNKAYRPVTEFNAKYDKSVILSIMILYDAINSDHKDNYDLNALSLRLSIHQATIDLLFRNQSDLLLSQEKEIKKRVYSLLPDIQKLIENKTPSKMGSKGGNKVKERRTEVLKFIVTKLQESNITSLDDVSEELCQLIIKKDKSLGGRMHKNKDTESSVKRVLAKAFDQINSS